MTARLAIISAGIMGADFARIIAHHLPGADIKVICDFDESRALRKALVTILG